MPTGQRIGYLARDPRNEGFLGLHSTFAYYSLARFTGYWAQTIDKPVTQWLEKNIVHNHTGVPSAQARHYWGLLEASAFSLVSLISFFTEKKQLKINIYDAIAAERGMNAEDVSIFSLYKSDNPFLRTLRNRFSLEQATRIPAALLFAKNVTAGILAITLNFTLERSMFLENNAYDILRNMVYEVQRLKVSGGGDIERVKIGLERAVQRTLAENHRRPLLAEELVANAAVFNRLTTDILSEKFSMNETLYILGEIANHPKDSARILQDMEKIEELGIRGFSRQKHLFGAEYANVAKKAVAPVKQSFSQLAAPSPTVQGGRV